MKFLELFAGIGGFRRGLEELGHECVGFVEWDKYARKSYQAIFPTAKDEWNAGDITTVTDESLRGFVRSTRQIDVIAGGFPCQAFSVAGKRRGFEDTRGTLFFDVARFAMVLRPKLLLLENVPGLLNHDKGRTFCTILCTLDELGYDAEWQVCNVKDFGIPQNRERVFIVGHLRGAGGRKVFPLREANNQTAAELECVGMLDIKGQDVIRRVYSPTGISPTLTTMTGGNREPKIVSAVNDCGREKKTQNDRRVKEPEEPMFTLTGQDRHGILQNARIRKLTPKECWRLMGRQDWEFERAKATGVSDSQLYKQAGNSLVPQIVTAIARNF